MPSHFKTNFSSLWLTPGKYTGALSLSQKAHVLTSKNWCNNLEIYSLTDRYRNPFFCIFSSLLKTSLFFPPRVTSDCFLVKKMLSDALLTFCMRSKQEGWILCHQEESCGKSESSCVSQQFANTVGEITAVCAPPGGNQTGLQKQQYIFKLEERVGNYKWENRMFLCLCVEGFCAWWEQLGVVTLWE